MPSQTGELSAKDSLLLLSQQYLDSDACDAQVGPGAGDESVYGNPNAGALRKLRGLVSMHHIMCGEL